MYIAIANAIYSSTLQGSGGGFPKACFGLDYNAITSDFTFTRNSFATRVNEFGLIETVTNLGSDVVENGSFDELGSEQVLNGDFSQEGSELVINGDFATDSDWTLVNGATISNDKLNIDYNLGNGSTTQTNVFTIGKTYKIEINVDNSSIGSARINNGVTATVLSNGLNTFYLEAVGTGIEIRNHVNFIGSIDNVSVKEVGQNWILGANTTIENGLAVVDSPTTPINALTQNNVLQASTNYKVSFEILDYVQGEVRLFNSFNDNTIYNANGIYEVYTTSFSSTGLRIFCKTGSILKIDNVSVKQVDPNDDWNNEGVWTIGDGYASGNGATGSSEELGQNISASGILVGDTVKCSFELKNYASGSVQVIGISNPINRSANGIYEFEGDIISTNIRFRGSAFNGDVTNLIIQEVIEDDIPRIDYTGSTFDVPILGNELITNGDFENGDTDWTVGSGWDIADEKATSDGTASNLDQSGAFLSGKTYKVTYDVLDYVSGDIRFRFTGTSNENGTLRTANGTYTEYITLTNNQSVFRFPSSAFEGSIDNVSVKEVTAYTTTDKGAFLLEPISTNEIAYSEDFRASQTTWINLGNPTITDNYGTSPDGTQNSTRVQGNSLTVIYVSNGAANTNFSRSIYIKATSGSGTIQALSHNSNTNNVFSIDENWRRVEINSLTSSSGDVVVYAIDMRGSSTDIFDVEIWGCQEERGIDYPTSYIPTSGTTVTRAQESCVDATPTINSEEGVLYAEISALADDGTRRCVSLSNGSTSNRVLLRYDGVSNRIQCFAQIGGTVYADISTTSYDTTDINKIAYRYKSGEYALYVNGVEQGTSTDATVFPQDTLTELSFRRGDNNASQDFYGRTKDLRVYCKALTDDELTELTTI